MKIEINESTARLAKNIAIVIAAIVICFIIKSAWGAIVLFFMD